MDEIDQITKEVEETMAHFKAIEENGKEKILHYFDRIHNNLFVFNNLMIAGFFTLSQLKISVSAWTIIIPILNLWFLIYIDYRLMEISRIESKITSISKSDIDKYGRAISKTTLISLLAIITTFLITVIFIFLLLKI